MPKNAKGLLETFLAFIVTIQWNVTVKRFSPSAGLAETIKLQDNQNIVYVLKSACQQ